MSPYTLNLPEVQREVFKRNYIRFAVCELRFPTLLEFEDKPPLDLQKRLRRDFPIYQRERSTLVSPAGATVEPGIKHIFRSRKGDWLVSFKASAISLETTKYTEFEDFSNQLERVLKQAERTLDSDFFTRVGLRFLNEIPLNEGTPNGWIREELVQPLVDRTYGQVTSFGQEVSGSTDDGPYTFRHGMALATSIEGSTITRPVYVLDFDFSKENVERADVIDLVRKFDLEGFRFFNWAIGDKTREALRAD